MADGYIARHWRGELTLPVSFWVNNFLLAGPVGFAIGALAAWIAVTGDYLRGGSIALLVAWPLLQARNKVADPRRLQPGSLIFIPVRLQPSESATVQFVQGEATAQARGSSTPAPTMKIGREPTALRHRANGLNQGQGPGPNEASARVGARQEQRADHGDQSLTAKRDGLRCAPVPQSLPVRRRSCRVPACRAACLAVGLGCLMAPRGGWGYAVEADATVIGQGYSLRTADVLPSTVNRRRLTTYLGLRVEDIALGGRASDLQPPARNELAMVVELRVDADFGDYLCSSSQTATGMESSITKISVRWPARPVCRIRCTRAALCRTAIATWCRMARTLARTSRGRRTRTRSATAARTRSSK